MMRLVMELATFEREPEAVVNTEKMLMEDGFGEYKNIKFLAKLDQNGTE